MASLLRGCPIPQLAEEDREMLNLPITLVELKEALEGAAQHKSPGPDGLPVEVYSQYGEVILQPLLEALFEAEEKGTLPDSMQEAIIILLSKPGKDKLSRDSYRPISLLNMDVKLLAKILAKRLSQVIDRGGKISRQT